MSTQPAAPNATLEAILGALRSTDPTLATKLQGALDSAEAAEAAEAAKPVTILDEIRNAGELVLNHTDIPGMHEIGSVVGVLVKRFEEVEADVRRLVDERDSNKSSEVTPAHTETPAGAEVESAPATSSIDVDALSPEQRATLLAQLQPAPDTSVAEFAAVAPAVGGMAEPQTGNTEGETPSE